MFYDIVTINDTNNFILNAFGPAMFPITTDSSDEGTLTQRFFTTGKLRIRQVRTKQKSNCPKSGVFNFNKTCYEYVYNSNTKSTANLSSNTTGKPYQVYHSSISAPSSYLGILASYESSGYYYDIPTNITLSYFQKSYEAILATN